MSAPLGLNIKSNTNEMTVGDCIPYRYTALTSGTSGNISELGTSTISEIPITGTATPDGTAYFIMVDTGLLICDRVVQTNMSWNALNNSGFIEGKIVTLNNTEYLIRSLSGGCAYVDENGNMSLTDKGLGAWSVNNEWDKYIVNSDLGGKITPGDDNIWHWNSLYSWGKDTPINNTVNSDGVKATNASRCVRGNINSKQYAFGSGSYGFRPVLQLKNSKQQNLWY